MYLDFQRLDTLPPELRARETDRILREIITAHNREMDELREEIRRGKYDETEKQ